MLMAEQYNLSAWYLNLRRLGEVIEDPEFDATVRGIEQLNSRLMHPGRFQPTLGAVNRIVTRWIRRQNVPSIEVLLIKSALCEGSFFVSYRNFQCKGLAQWGRYLDSGGRGKKPPAPMVYASLEATVPATRLELPYNHEHLVSTSAWTELQGSKRLFAFGYVQSHEDRVVSARPYVIADLLGPDEFFSAARDYFEVQATSIESFERARDVSPVRATELNALRDIGEAKIKSAFADIIGEPVVPKDWGGERSDLFTTQLVWDGQRRAAAFAFKGPARFSEMNLAHLGKNGDQIERLFTEPAELVVLQHCHRVHRSVRSMMRAYAVQPGQSKHWCIIDGYETIRILRAYGKCGL